HRVPDWPERLGHHRARHPTAHRRGCLSLHGRREESYGDGYATERIVERLRRYFAARDLGRTRRDGTANDRNVKEGRHHGPAFDGESGTAGKAARVAPVLASSGPPPRQV